MRAESRYLKSLNYCASNSGLCDSYVLLFEGENQINNSFFEFIFPRDTIKKLEEFDAELAEISEAEKLAILKDFNDDSIDENIGAPLGDIFSQLKLVPEATQNGFDALPDNQKSSVSKMHTALLGFFLCHFFQ